MTTRGGLWLRVASGDVTVMKGNPIWLSVEESEHEDQLRRAHPLSCGPDHYDPNHPSDNSPTANCISRRCYGWTVPESSPVFLEGDVRLDLYQKTTLLGVTTKDRGKIGHIWFNTMFCCHGFCGHVFQHGDEVHPYVCNTTTTTAASLPQGGSAASTPAVGSKEARNRTRNGRSSNGVNKLGSVDDSGTQPPFKTNGDKQPPRRAISVVSTPRTSKDAKMADVDVASLTPALTPPGLAHHCPDPTLIYGHNLAPRHRIQQQLLTAHNAGLLRDTYNERRQSETQPLSASLLPKAPVGRPANGGPVCVERLPDEHVSTFSVLEIDRACKNKNLDTSFKVHIVTRCIDPSDEEMMRTSDAFINKTLFEQKTFDDERGERVAQRQRRLDSSSSEKESSKDSPAVVCPLASSEGSEESTKWDCDDERRRDGRYERFFFRQRADSLSSHPPSRYQCPLLSAATPRQEKSVSPMGEDILREENEPICSGGGSFEERGTLSTDHRNACTSKSDPSRRPDTLPSGAGGHGRPLDNRCPGEVDLGEFPTTSSDSCTD
uniref:C2 tensin-type domain-containing protein n=1 Tax=Plectus sambesii TaxID=2011161 RepID=A0A914XMY7_9BILA